METVFSTWRDADGNHHRIEEMSTKYINNCVEQIRRIAPEYGRCHESELTADEIREKQIPLRKAWFVFYGLRYLKSFRAELEKRDEDISELERMIAKVEQMRRGEPSWLNL